MSDPKVSRTAGIFPIVLPSASNPTELRTVLVLDREEMVKQLDSSVFTKPRFWGLPKGRQQAVDDGNVVQTALRELFEETGITEVTREMIDPELSVTSSEPSLREGSDIHEKTFFAVILNHLPKIGVPVDPKIEKVGVFSLSNLPRSGPAKLAKSHQRAISELLEKCQPKILALGVHPMILAEIEVSLESRKARMDELKPE